MLWSFGAGNFVFQLFQLSGFDNIGRYLGSKLVIDFIVAYLLNMFIILNSSRAEKEGKINKTAFESLGSAYNKTGDFFNADEYFRERSFVFYASNYNFFIKF